MATISFDEIIKDLKQKKYHPIYLLMGDEAYFIDEITNYITANVLTEEEKSFNFTVLYGKDTDVAGIINAAKRFPMMSEYQVIIVKEAQEASSRKGHANARSRTSKGGRSRRSISKAARPARRSRPATRPW